MTFLIMMPLVIALGLQQSSSPYALIGSIALALISAIFGVINLYILRKNQSVLQTQQAELIKTNQTDLANLQAELTRSNQTQLANLQADLTLKTQTELDKAKTELSERSQARLESLKADLTSKNQEDIEFLRSTLSDQSKERDARRDYEYEARKRLYDQVEPIRFHLHEGLEEAHFRVRSLTRTARDGNLSLEENWLNGPGYYMRSTIYKLFLPVAYFRLLRSRMTFTDFNLDNNVALQYALLKLYMRSFTDDFDFASLKPKLAYDPNHRNAQRLRKENPAVYSRQALVLGDLECIADLLITREDGKTRVLQFGEFEMLFEQKKDNDENLQEALNLFLAFTAKSKPVLARLLLAQACFAKLILSTYESGNEAAPLSVRLAEIVADGELVQALAWSKEQQTDLSFVQKYWEPGLKSLDRDS